MGFLIGVEMPTEMLSGNAFYDAIGLGMKYIQTPVGVYGFLTSFLMIATGMNGMYLGLSLFTEECVGKTADFLLTKPYSRGQIYCAKLIAAIGGIIIIGTAYLLGSFGAVLTNGVSNFDCKLVLMIGVTATLISLFFLVIGILIGVLLPNIRTPTHCFGRNHLYLLHPSRLFPENRYIREILLLSPKPW